LILVKSKASKYWGQLLFIGDSATFEFKPDSFFLAMVYLKAVLVPTLFALFLKSIVAKNVYYNFESHYFTGSPDGVSVPHILGVNGQFPGPTIEATEGDVLYINLKNNINRKGNLTTLHWHGLFQNGTPFEDGPSMVTQCPIPYGKTQLYIIPLKQHGTYW